MSHYSEIKVQFRRVDSLIAALVASGVPRQVIEVHTEPQPLLTYAGKPGNFRWANLKDARFQSGDSAHVIIRREAVGRMCNDIGFWVDAEQGESVAFVCDFAKREGLVFNPAIREFGGYGDAWLNRLSAEYAVLETVRTHRENGEYTEVVEDGEHVYVYASV